MNKTEFINALSEKLSYPKAKCEIINNILENNFFISRANKAKIIVELSQQLKVDDETADKIYNTTVTIINAALKDKIRHMSAWKGKST